MNVHPTPVNPHGLVMMVTMPTHVSARLEREELTVAKVSECSVYNYIT